MEVTVEEPPGEMWLPHSLSLILIPSLCSDVAEATGVAEGTIRSTYKDLLPFAAELLPSWFAKPEDIRRLPLS